MIPLESEAPGMVRTYQAGMFALKAMATSAREERLRRARKIVEILQNQHFYVMVENT